jgi:hypothetical protein
MPKFNVRLRGYVDFEGLDIRIAECESFEYTLDYNSVDAKDMKEAHEKAIIMSERWKVEDVIHDVEINKVK